jgi:hypothetical protein
MEFQCQGTADGRLDFGPYNRAKFQQFLQEHPGIRLKITAELPESGKLRRFYEGAVVPLLCFYDEKLDHRSNEDRQTMREVLKQEFNGQMVQIGGKMHVVGKSTKGRAILNPFVERVIDWLTENYAPPAEALDPEKYKEWRDTIFPDGGPDNYIDYLQEVGLLRRV